MAVRDKTFIPNEIYFITFTINGWKNIFIKDEYCQLIFKWFDYVRKNYGNKVYGYVIMPNHVHCLMHISSQSKSLPILILNAKRFLACGIVDLLEKDKNQELLNYFQENKTDPRLKYKIFTNRYDSLIIQNRKFFLEKLNYIHKNPCQEKWQLADCSENYKYSSASNYTSNNGVYFVDIMDF
jgi:REP element-mobilizing transposase RayT